jgi:VWFA-related protein
MKQYYLPCLSLIAPALALVTALVQPQQALPQQPENQAPTVKANVDEVVLDLIVRDKKGKPVTDLKPDDLVITDNGVRQHLSSFRLVRGSEAISQTGAATRLDPLRQLRLVTLAFESLGEASQRKTAREAAVDLIKGEQGTNVFYSVVALNTRLLVLQPFTSDKAKLNTAIEKATAGSGGPKMVEESDAIQAQLKQLVNANGITGADQAANLLSAATTLAGTAPGRGGDNTAPILAQVMLDMLRMDAGAASQGTRLSLEALKSLVQGLVPMPGRKSVLYFSAGMVVPPELDVMYKNVISAANRSNVTFYSVDTRGVTTYSDNSEATNQLRAAASASGNTMTRQDGGATKNEIMAQDNAENAGRSNMQLRIRDLAEATGGFLIGESNDVRGPLHNVNEEISSYYETTYNPGIQNYDGSFRKVAVADNRKDLVIHARNGYFALPPEAVASGLQSFEMPLLKAISDGKESSDVGFSAGAVLLQPKAGATDVNLMIEVPLHGLTPKAGTTGPTQSVHCSLAMLVKDSTGAVVAKVTRDRSYNVSADQLKLGNMVENSTISLPPGKYTLETAVLDYETTKTGMHRSELTVPAATKGVAISSLTFVRSYTPDVKGLDPNEPFQFQGGRITPTLNNAVPRTEGSALRMFFTVYIDAAVSAKPAVEVEFLQNGKSLTKVPMPLPDPDKNGKIPYVMTIPASAIPAGEYEVRAVAKQGDTSSQSETRVRIE